jgi:3-oxoacyl-[acyl-carrier protein] reductase
MKKVILVTGGATGIGAGIVSALANDQKNTVLLTYNKSYAAAKSIKKEFSNTMILKMDVTDSANILETKNAIKKEFGFIDCIINNAGGNIGFNSTNDYPEGDWDKTFDLNCKSVFLVCKYFIPILNNGSSIINISSISGKSGGAPGGMAYAASKAAVDCMTKSLAKELAAKLIRVNGISPGIVYTDQHKKFSTIDYYQSLIEKVPLGRDGTVDDIAQTVRFLISKSGSYITGQTIDVNGGMLMR